MSQTNQILKLLKAGQTITPIIALNLFGCMRLAARILEIRNMGYNVLTTTITANGKNFAGYKLIDGA